MRRALPSIVVTNEHLLEKGAELDFLVANERIYLAKTLSVQDFEDYGRRDYQRPARLLRIGMLPPKVAQIMINLAYGSLGRASKGPKNAILDPFVGSGTVLQEAMLMGYKAVGSDISEKAVESTEKNLEWIKNRYKIPPARFDLFVSDVADIIPNLPDFAYEAIVTEGTLGPAYTKSPDEEEIKKNFKNLEKIYLAAFRVFKKILKPDKRVVIALPAYRNRNTYRFMPIVDKIVKLGYDVVNPVPEVLRERFEFLQVSSRGSIVYDRKDQFVSREIFIFKI